MLKKKRKKKIIGVKPDGIHTIRELELIKRGWLNINEPDYLKKLYSRSLPKWPWSGFSITFGKVDLEPTVVNFKSNDLGNHYNCGKKLKLFKLGYIISKVKFFYPFMVYVNLKFIRWFWFLFLVWVTIYHSFWIPIAYLFSSLFYYSFAGFLFDFKLFYSFDKTYNVYAIFRNECLRRCLTSKDVDELRFWGSTLKSVEVHYNVWFLAEILYPISLFLSIYKFF